jgi:hypothetical protein
MLSLPARGHYRWGNFFVQNGRSSLELYEPCVIWNVRIEAIFELRLLRSTLPVSNNLNNSSMLRQIQPLFSRLLPCLLVLAIFGGEAWHLVPGVGHSDCCSGHVCSGATHSHAKHTHSHRGGCSHHHAHDVTVTTASETTPEQCKSLPKDCVVCKNLALRVLVGLPHIEIITQEYIACLYVAEPLQRPREILLASAPRGPPTA